MIPKHAPRAVALFAVALALSACGSSNGGFSSGGDDDAGGAPDGTSPPPSLVDGGALTTDGGPPTTCQPNGSDLAGCQCPTPGAMQPCYPSNVDPRSRHVGACKDGTQTCQKSGEFLEWSACTGAVTPTTEACTSTVDSNCNGKVGCADPSCATDPSCNTGCTDGQTRACYDGPAGTENVGTCKDGTQTCSGGKWPAGCPGEVLPTKENCSDAKDHNCNNLPGCLDLFACITSPACQGQCDSSKLDPGCVCAQNAGDTATCPDGTHGVSQPGTITSPGGYECCPCTAKDCATDTNCCAESVCAGSSACASVTCHPLPPSCNGQTNADCDDFPEDCDEPCCKCSSCDDAGP